MIIARNQKLTKARLFELPTGMHLVSNTHHSIWLPVFAEMVAPMPAREAQWRRIVAARVNGRCFYLFTTADGYKRMVEEMEYGPQLSAANN